MFEQTIALSSNETLRLNWEKNYANLVIYLNGQPIESIPDKAALQLGRTFRLTDNRQFIVILSNNNLAVWHNNMDILNNVKSGTYNHFSNAVWFLIGCGVVLLVAGIINVITIYQTIPGIILSLAPGLAFTGLGLWAKSSNEVFPLQIALGITVVVAVTKFFITGLGLFGIALFSLLIYSLAIAIRSGAIILKKARTVNQDSPLDAGI